MTSKKTLKELKQAAKLPAREAGGSTVQEFFEMNKASMAAVLPRHVTPERMLRLALGALRTTPALRDATVESLMGAVMLCAQVGLEPNTPLGHAYLIPFKNKKAGRTDVQVIFGYKGLLDLARRSGQIISISSYAVHESDHFDFAYGLNPRLEHVPARTNRGAIIAFYAVANLVGGGHQFEVMFREEADAVMKGTQSGGRYGPWRDHYSEMGRKTAIRKLFKYLPVSIEVATAVAVDEVHDAGGDQHLHTALEGDYAITSDDYRELDVEDDEAAPAADSAPKNEPGQTYPQSFTDEDTGEIIWSDSNGEFFDAAKHESGKGNQSPPVTLDGQFIRKQ